jgi:hypothetical protein
VVLVLVIATNAFFGASLGERVVIELLMALLLVFSVLTFVRHRRLLVVGVVLAGATLATAVASNVVPTLPLIITRHGLTALFLLFTTGVLLAAVLARGPVTLDRISGAVCVYLFLGLTWGSLFLLVELVAPGSMSVPASGPVAAEVLQHGRDVGGNFSYFSFVTLTTLGYGDILPVSRLARVLAWLEAVVGQLYLTVLVAALVGMHIGSYVTSKRD